MLKYHYQKKILLKYYIKRKRIINIKYNPISSIHNTYNIKYYYGYKNNKKTIIIN